MIPQNIIYVTMLCTKALKLFQLLPVSSLVKLLNAIQVLQLIATEY